MIFYCPLLHIVQGLLMSPLPVGQSGNATCRVRNELNSHSPESRGVDCRRGGSVLIRFVVADRRYDNR